MINKRRLAVSREIAAPAAEVWTLISEFRHWPQWGPTVNDVISDSACVAGGATGHVVTPLRLRLPFTITTVNPGRSWDWEVAGQRATGHEVAPLADGRSVVTFSVDWFYAPYVVVLRLGLRRLAALAEARAVTGDS